MRCLVGSTSVRTDELSEYGDNCRDWSAESDVSIGESIGRFARGEAGRPPKGESGADIVVEGRDRRCGVLGYEECLYRGDALTCCLFVPLVARSKLGAQMVETSLHEQRNAQGRRRGELVYCPRCAAQPDIYECIRGAVISPHQVAVVL